MRADLDSHQSSNIDVVIPTFNGWSLTERCLDHLAVQTVTHTVIVVDNGSTDGTPDLVRAKVPAARVIELGANLGFPVACNRGAAAGSAEVIVLLNNDVEARPDFLERLAQPLAEDPTVGSAAALLVQRMLGLVPHLTRQMQQRMAQAQAAAAQGQP